MDVLREFQGHQELKKLPQVSSVAHTSRMCAWSTNYLQYVVASHHKSQKMKIQRHLFFCDWSEVF